MCLEKKVWFILRITISSTCCHKKILQRSKRKLYVMNLGTNKWREKRAIKDKN